MYPLYPSSAQVISTDPENMRVFVKLLQYGTEAPVVAASVMVMGANDGKRINQRVLPGKGTIGIVCAINGDPRSLVWFGGIPANGVDAITSGPGNDFFDYESHYSGFYRLMDESGNLTEVWPDGTNILIGISGIPTTYRHQINANTGLRERVEYQQSERVANTPSPFPIYLNHSSGTKLSIDASGNISVSGVASINILAPDNITINTNSGNQVYVGTSGTSYQLVDSRLVNLFNNHVHSGIFPGGSDTGPPTEDMAIGSQTTTATFAN